MANNRMILLCNVCQPSDGGWTYGQKGVLALAKWYPADFAGEMREHGAVPGDGAYYNNLMTGRDGAAKWANQFFDFLVKHEHSELPSEHYRAGAGQDNPVRMIYESIDMPVLP